MKDESSTTTHSKQVGKLNFRLYSDFVTFGAIGVTIANVTRETPTLGQVFLSLAILAIAGLVTLFIPRRRIE